MWRQATNFVKMKAASWMALEKQRIRVCEAAKAYCDGDSDGCTGNEYMERIQKLQKEVKRLEAMEAIQ